MKIDVTVETPTSGSVRAAQVSSMFDVPYQDVARLEWHGDLPIEGREWQIGLIVGPSGCGKSTLLNTLFGEPQHFDWLGKSVIDDFDPRHDVDAIAQICQAVGFNTIPAWLRPYRVLSTGEKFRVDLARRLIAGEPITACDEFTSVVDRQVARIGSHAVQKYIRRAPGRQFIAATCHYDLEDWLQPDWVFEPATMCFRWRSVQRRPSLNCTIHRAPYDAWHAFSRFHYLTAELNRAARCYVLSVEGEPAAFAAALYKPHRHTENVYGMSRLVTLPDFQGMGLAFALADRLGAAFGALGWRYRAYPAHPMLVRSFDRSPVWHMLEAPKMTRAVTNFRFAKLGGRPNAVFEYRGAVMDHEQAVHLLGADNSLLRRTAAANRSVGHLATP